MKRLIIQFAVLCALFPRTVLAEKLMLAHVAINPSQGMLHLAKDSGILAKYGFTADVILIPGTPRTIQALIAGDLDFVAAGAPASLRARAQGADVTILSTLANVSAQRVFLRPDSKLTSFSELRGKIIGVTQYGSGGDTFLRAALRKTGIKESEVTILQMGGTPGVAQGLESG
ncbi:MAG TPA: ABC transporter substrate-binding protein, partial [Candidatus Binatia bacterium]|nr:ABC transporter substrate-binding protein [Candidatus Binatia bacterium]